MPKRKKVWESFGQRMKAIREDKGISLENLSQGTGYPLDVLQKVEAGDTPPPVSLVLQLSRTLKVDVEQIETEEEEKAFKRRDASHKKRVESYAYTPLGHPESDKHLRAYMVTIDPETNHKGVEYHHEGEEFIYVLDGSLTIQVGQDIEKLKKGENIHFNSGLNHKLSNPGHVTAELLVVIYVP